MFIAPHIPNKYYSSWAQYSILLPDNVKRDISYLFNIKNGITEMTGEDRDYLLSKFDETRRKIIYSMPNQFGKDMKIKSFINPNYAEIHNNKGNALKNLELYDEAIASYNKVIEINPDYYLS